MLADPANAAEGREVTTRVSPGRNGAHLVGRSATGQCWPIGVVDRSAGGRLDRYFAVDRARPDSYRVRTRDQVQLANRRRQQMSVYGDLEDVGCWCAIRRASRGCHARPPLPSTMWSSRLMLGEGRWLEGDASFSVWPEDILAVFDHAEEAEAALARLAGRLDAGSEGRRHGA